MRVLRREGYSQIFLSLGSQATAWAMDCRVKGDIGRTIISEREDSGLFGKIRNLWIMETFRQSNSSALSDKWHW